MKGHYIIGPDGKTPIPEPNLHKWGAWFQSSFVARRVALTEVGDVSISTVFLGLDHNFFRSGDPLLFETMVFGGALNEECERYSTWDGALAGHWAMVEQVKVSLAEGDGDAGD